MAHLLMADVLDKLLLLDYENKFCRVYTKGALQPLHPVYFAAPAHNPAEQFFYFTQLFAWLAGVCGSKMAPPGRSEDPNSVTALIIQELKKMGFTTDYPITRVRQGHGEVVCHILNQLINVVLSTTGFQFGQPAHDQTTGQEEEVIEETPEEVEAEQDDMIMADDAPIEDEDDSEEGQMAGKLQAADDSGAGTGETAADPQQWQLEVERVTPLLKVHVSADTRDWRSRKEQMSKHRATIGTLLPDVKPQLERMTADMSKQLEQIETHEKYLNEQLSQLIEDFSTASTTIKQLDENFQKATESKDSLAVEIGNVKSELLTVKEESSVLRSSLDDASPVVNLKKSLAKTKEEIRQMDVQIGVIQHTLLQAKMRERHLHPTALANATTDSIPARFGAILATVVNDMDG
eukprot:TRINITY_DN4239_c0_g1_i1.p1 TRINITY_DN4239_c0_g1~~TRINITY_DN4239_c0_g1_i1.p1  ORF type:complete len:467 (-),score=165.41 TRINITY_DN4239_c0_g1_i1:42-1256(-)